MVGPRQLGPRFVPKDLDYNDFVTTTPGLDRWEDWLDDAVEDVAAEGVGLVGVSMGRLRRAARRRRITRRGGHYRGGPYDFGDCWQQLPPITRETFRHHSGAADDAVAQARASASKESPPG
jgi:choline dehydrogenase-like flavoprotein